MQCRKSGRVWQTRCLTFVHDDEAIIDVTERIHILDVAQITKLALLRRAAPSGKT